MVIRPMTAAYALGEIGRPATTLGGKSGPAALFSTMRDIVALGRDPAPDAGLYTGKPTFKIMGAVELMSDDMDMVDATAGLADNPFLL